MTLAEIEALEARVRCQEMVILRQQVRIAILEKQVAQKQLYIERQERHRAAEANRRPNLIEQVFTNGKDKARAAG